MSTDPAVQPQRSRTGRIIVFATVLGVLAFVVICVARAIVAQLFFSELPVRDGPARGLSLADKTACLERANGLQRDLSAAVLLEIQTPWQGGSPDERWNNAQLDWNRDYAAAYKACIVAGDERMRTLFARLAAEQQGYQRLVEFYVSKVRTFALQRAESQGDLAAELSRQRR